MMQLICEICGSTDLIKNDGVFVCQACGCKYSVEEVRKMMVEGTVSVDGVVKTESVDFVVRAGELIKYNGAETDILIPDGIKIIGWECFVGMVGIESVIIPEGVYKIRVGAFNGCTGLKTVRFPNSLIEIEDQAFSGCTALKEVKLPDNVQVIGNRCFQFCSSLESVYLPDSLLEISDSAFKYTPKLQTVRLPVLLDYDAPGVNSMYADCGSKAIYLQYVQQKRATEAAVEVKKGGCYIATAVYGSYDCPQVWTLRRYRDYTLAKTWCGRAFIRSYYAVSPLLIKWFGHTKWFKKFWRDKLDRMIRNLNAKGVENTPYKDRMW